MCRACEAPKKRRADAIDYFLMHRTRLPREPREPVAKRRRRSSSSEKENEPREARAMSIAAMLKRQRARGFGARRLGGAGHVEEVKGWL